MRGNPRGGGGTLWCTEAGVGVLKREKRLWMKGEDTLLDSRQTGKRKGEGPSTTQSEVKCFCGMLGERKKSKCLVGERKGWPSAPMKRRVFNCEKERKRLSMKGKKKTGRLHDSCAERAGVVSKGKEIRETLKKGYVCVKGGGRLLASSQQAR